MFCGAGISIPGNSSAPGFLDIRNNLIIGIAESLTKRGIIGEREKHFIIKAVQELSFNKLNIPPEMIFSSLVESFGETIISKVLRCLNEGTPNENHIAIRHLATQPSTRLQAIITPNFDTFIEQVLYGLPYTVYLPGIFQKGLGLPIVKPHGSLNEISSIMITLEDLWSPVTQSSREMIKQIVSDRTVVVIGYSGMDSDLFPLLAYGGRYWNTQIVWVLWNQTALNSKVKIIQLALGDNCVVLDGQEKNILAEMSNLSMSKQVRKNNDLDDKFAEIMDDYATIDLIHAFTQLLGPLGTQQFSQINDRLQSAQLNQLEKYGSSFDFHRLNLILQIVKYSESKKIRTSAIRLGEKIALDAHNLNWLKQFEHYKAVEPGEDDNPKIELQDIDFSLNTDFFPYLEKYKSSKKAKNKRFLTLGQLRRKAELLEEMGSSDEAEKIIRKLLEDYPFPETGISEEAALYAEAAEEGKLRYILARILIERGEKAEAEKEICQSIDIFWRELDMFELDFALSIVQELLFGELVAKRCIALALSLAVKVAQLEGNFAEEIENIVTKLKSGFGDEQDLENAKILLIQAKKIRKDLDILDYEELKERINTAERNWFRDGKAIFLKRMLTD